MLQHQCQEQFPAVPEERPDVRSVDSFSLQGCAMSEHQPAPDQHASDALPGTRLKLEREHQGLSRDEVATQLNLRPSLVDDLERDHYDQIPIAAYRRGYLRAYARLLGMDEKAIVGQYNAQFGTTEAERYIKRDLAIPEDDLPPQLSSTGSGIADSLPKKPSELIDLALSCLLATEGEAHVKIRMSAHHKPRGNDLLVGLAGCVMRQQLRTDRMKTYGFTDFTPSLNRKLAFIQVITTGQTVEIHMYKFKKGRVIFV